MVNIMEVSNSVCINTFFILLIIFSVEVVNMHVHLNIKLAM